MRRIDLLLVPFLLERRRCADLYLNYPIIGGAFCGQFHRGLKMLH